MRSGVMLGPTRGDRTAGKRPGGLLRLQFGGPPLSGTFRLSRVNSFRRPFKPSRAAPNHKGSSMKRKSGKPIVDLDKKPAVVHFNVGCGYLTYLEQEASEQVPRVKSV